MENNRILKKKNHLNNHLDNNNYKQLKKIKKYYRMQVEGNTKYILRV